MPGAHDTNLGKLLDVFIVAVARKGGRGGAAEKSWGTGKKTSLALAEAIGTPPLVRLTSYQS
jgi:hypothetical protein